jgi:hypothetical protein
MPDHRPTGHRRERNAREKARATTDLFKIEGVHRQSPLGRRYEDLVTGFVAELGGDVGLTDVQRAAIRRAGELTAYAEQQRQKALRGETIDELALVRLEGLAARAVRDLRLRDKSARPRGPSFRDYVASKTAASA